jgi:hypothetical protein
MRHVEIDYRAHGATPEQRLEKLSEALGQTFDLMLTFDPNSPEYGHALALRQGVVEEVQMYARHAEHGDKLPSLHGQGMLRVGEVWMNYAAEEVEAVFLTGDGRGMNALDPHGWEDGPGSGSTVWFEDVLSNRHGWLDVVSRKIVQTG